MEPLPSMGISEGIDAVGTSGRKEQITPRVRSAWPRCHNCDLFMRALCIMSAVSTHQEPAIEKKEKKKKLLYLHVGMVGGMRVRESPFIQYISPLNQPFANK